MADDGMETVAKRQASFRMKDGREITFSSLTLGDFVSAREQALQEYKREKIKTWTANLDLIPEDQRDAWVRQAFERAEEITAEGLPDKELDLPQYLGNGKVKRDSRNQPVFKKQKVEYAMWWMSDTAGGRLYMTWLSMRKAPGQQDMTLADADALFTESLDDLENAAQLVGDLSQSKLSGNSETPPAPATEGRAKRRTRRRR